MRVSRARTVEIRWVGDAVSEVAAIDALGYPSMMEASPGVCERWMRIPASRVEAVQDAIVAAGGVLK